MNEVLIMTSIVCFIFGLLVGYFIKAYSDMETIIEDLQEEVVDLRKRKSKK